MAHKYGGMDVEVLLDQCMSMTCGECGRQVSGLVGLRLIVWQGVPGVEVYLCEPHEAHLVGRLPVKRLPVGIIANGDTSATA